MNLRIVQAGEEPLRRCARDLTDDEIRGREIAELVESMRETMREAPGVGLAAPQIGMALNLAVIEDRAEYHKDLTESQMLERERKPVPFHVIINPRIVHYSSERVEFVEGCLSVSGFVAMVSRSRSIKVECLEETGAPRVIEATGWYSRILQHEIDHLNGTLYIDRMDSRTFMSSANYVKFFRELSVEEFKSAVSG